MPFSWLPPRAWLRAAREGPGKEGRVGKKEGRKEKRKEGERDVDGRLLRPMGSRGCDLEKQSLSSPHAQLAISL